MENFHFIELVGEGYFGKVWKACDKCSGELVAIKKLRYKSCPWEREVKSLSKMNHPNIVKFHKKIEHYDSIYLVFEYMQTNLSNVIQQRRPFLLSKPEVRSYCFQILQGLRHMHKRNYFHRDLKPANLLVSENVIKIADFGMAKRIDSGSRHTARVTDRSYRAPEMILTPQNYDRKVDMWALGAIMAEMFALNMRPIFYGEDSYKVMGRICYVLGTPTNETWPEGLDLAKCLNYRFPESPGLNLSRLLPSASNDAINLILWLCSWDPKKRPTTLQALQHPFFTNNGFCPSCG